MTRGGDGSWAEVGHTTGPQPTVEVFGGEIDLAAMAPTITLMTNLPAFASLNYTLIGFVLDTPGILELFKEDMLRKLCDHHRPEGENALKDSEKILAKHREILSAYLDGLGIERDTCEHD